MDAARISAPTSEQAITVMSPASHLKPVPDRRSIEQTLPIDRPDPGTRVCYGGLRVARQMLGQLRRVLRRARSKGGRSSEEASRRAVKIMREGKWRKWEGKRRTMKREDGSREQEPLRNDAQVADLLYFSGSLRNWNIPRRGTT
ncbi:hypothetical protein B0H17DRAFT_1145694 [Mycena rosella]|uniref:Uncharacterized protein n=1 Tax=Mycena rosella TaxID=1033263 RepID=A0AAD7G5A0_MYCRO|nr:hypothetical protein B0H17DRAFT_1145694 [Mycena rosella]